MKIIFYEKGADLDAWLGGLRRELPEADLRVWEPGDTAPADYAIVWRAPRELFANRPDLKAVFNLGAGVDAILDVERKEPGTLPPNAKLVRLEDTGMAQQMVEYATYCGAALSCAVSTNTTRCNAKAAGKSSSRISARVVHGRRARAWRAGRGSRAGADSSACRCAVTAAAKTIEGVRPMRAKRNSMPFLDGVKVLINLLPHTPDTEGILNARTFGSSRAARIW